MMTDCPPYLREVQEEDVLTQLRSLGFKEDEANGGYKTRDFYARMWYNKEDPCQPCWWIELAVRKNFDRWANSINFRIRCICFADRLKLKWALKHARKIVRAKLFDWNKYIPAIELDSQQKEWQE